MTTSVQIAMDLKFFMDWLRTVKDEDQRVRVALLVRDMVKKAKAV